VNIRVVRVDPAKLELGMVGSGAVQLHAKFARRGADVLMIKLMH